MNFVKILSLLGLYISCVVGLTAQPVRDQYVEAELVAEHTALVPGEKNTLALRLNHDPKWHTYWINPGDAGLETMINWELPEGYKAGEIIWPAPMKLPLPGIMNYGYEDEVFLLIELDVPEDATTGEEITLKASVDWLMCTDICIPGSAELQLTLAVAEDPQPSEWAEAIAASRATVERESNTWEQAASISGSSITLKVTPQGGANLSPEDIYFFSLDFQIEPIAEQRISRTDDGSIILQLKKAGAAPTSDSLEGVLYASNGWLNDDESFVSLLINAPYGEPIPVAGSTGGDAGMPLGIALLLAFGGGFILNLMPCVFPVIGLKIMSFVKQSSQSRSLIALHGAIFTLGVLVSMWVLAAIVLAVRAGGTELGWGFQLQNPLFNIFLTFFLLIFALNLSGLFEIGGSAVGIGQKLTGKSGLTGTFFMGALAVVVGTPCTAPLLGSILPIAMSGTTGSVLLFFTTIGLGLALPYIILGFFPQLVYKLPKPGAWMESFKQAMAFLLYATVAFFVYILAGQLEEATLLNFLLSLVGIAVACWIYGRWGSEIRKKRTRYIGRGVAALLLLGMVGFAYPKHSDITWEDWSPARVAELEADGTPYFIDFTARWCASCQSNKRIVFTSNEVKRLINSKGIVLLKADWTNRDESITQALSDYGRNAVPLNILVAPTLEEPIILPEVMVTPDPAIQAFEQI